MKTGTCSTRINSSLAHLLVGALMAMTLASPAQTASEHPYTVTDVGANYRVWQRTVQLTNSETGEVAQKVQEYTELDEGMNYWTTNSAQAQGGWAESQDLIEITPTGARAVHGQMKAVISGDVTSTGAITLTTASGQVFQSRPLGLYYADALSGKVAQVALVQPGPGLLYTPNIVVFTNAFSGLNADLILVWARNGFEQNVLLKESPPAPEVFGLSSVSCRLQMWTAMDQCPEPVEDRPALLGSGLWDHILIFPDCWFPIGSAYEFGNAPISNSGEAAAVRPLSPSDQGAFPTAKSLVTIAGQKVLVEEINYSDLQSAFKALGHASLPRSNPRAVEFAALGQLLPAPPVARQGRPILLAAGPYQGRGITLDYIQLSGSTNSCTFTSGTTYYIPASYYQGPGTATFQNNTCLKFASNAWLIAYGAVSFPSSDAPVVCECECTFILANDSSTIVAAFGDTHLSEVGFGSGYTFSNIPTPRSTWWARSTNGGLSFTNTQPLPPWGTGLTNTWKGDALNPMMTYDPNYPSNSSGTVYLLANPSREQATWFGFRLWASTNNGQSFTLINTNLPGGPSGPIKCDRPAVKADPTTHYLYAAGTSTDTNGVAKLFAARSTTHGTNWDLYQPLDTSAGQTDIAVKPNGAVYVFWVTYPGNGPTYTNRLRYAWLMPGSTNWSGPNDVGITLNSTLIGGHRYPLRFNGDSSADYFLIIPFPRAAYANSQIYLAYSDLPSSNQSTFDKGDVFLAELNITPSDGSLTLTRPPRLVNNDHTQTDQWDAAIAANPQGTELFIGNYSRQENPATDSLIKAYGAKVYNIVNGLGNATIDCFPISPTAFPTLFNGTNDPANLQFDPVYPPDYWPNTLVCFDEFARVSCLQTNGDLCPTYPIYTFDAAYINWFFQDDNTWADADTNYFYYAWCDRSRTWAWTVSGIQNTRPDADVKLAKIRQ